MPAPGPLPSPAARSPSWNATFTYEKPEPELLTLAGTFDGHTLRAELRRIDKSKLPLVRHGFQWVHEPSFDG